MLPVFTDTFYWIALLNPDDPDHDRVTAFDLSLQRPPLVTTDEVLTEFLTWFSGRGSLLRMKAAAVAYALQDDPDVRLLSQTSESFSAGLRLYGERPDKEYSLTDCISIAAMKAEGMTESATGDLAFRTGRLPGAVSPLTPARSLRHDWRGAATILSTGLFSQQSGIELFPALMFFGNAVADEFAVQAFNHAAIKARCFSPFASSLQHRGNTLWRGNTC